MNIKKLTTEVEALYTAAVENQEKMNDEIEQRNAGIESAQLDQQTAINAGDQAAYDAATRTIDYNTARIAYLADRAERLQTSADSTKVNEMINTLADEKTAAVKAAAAKLMSVIENGRSIVASIAEIDEGTQALFMKLAALTDDAEMQKTIVKAKDPTATGLIRNAFNDGFAVSKYVGHLAESGTGSGWNV